MFTAHNRAKDRVLAAQHLSGLREITCFNCVTDCCAAHQLTVPERDSGNSDDFKVEFRAQLS
jgi:hypothetical protein